MSMQTREGIRAAKALLSLIDESSAEELEAAEAILGGDKELTNILQLLRRYKGHEVEPLSVDGLRAIVLREISRLNLSSDAQGDILVIAADVGIPLPPILTVGGFFEEIVEHIESVSASRGKQVGSLIDLLTVSANKAGPEHRARIDALLRELAIQALTENLVMFPTVHALAQLRTRWAPNTLPYQEQESRKHLATRLLADAERLAPAKLRDLTIDLLREGLRGPADGEIARLRAARPKKAHGA
jgi:hypothetical protein